jgi:hypothetical protein
MGATPSATLALLPPLPPVPGREAYCGLCGLPVARERDEHGLLVHEAPDHSVEVEWRP